MKYSRRAPRLGEHTSQVLEWSQRANSELRLELPKERAPLRSRCGYSNINTVRATSPAFIARKASFTSSSLPRRLIMSSRLSRPCK
jgi:hypothetical protein